MGPLIFVPGFQEDRESRDYEPVLRFFGERGYSPSFAEINWRRTTQKDWVRQLEKLRSEVGFQAPLAGFSFGAVTALLSAADRQPSELWLFSLSPLFAETDRSWTATDRKVLGKGRLCLAVKTPLTTLAQRITCPVRIFLGEKEADRWPEMRQCFDIVLSQAVSAKGSVLDGVGHAVDDLRYMYGVVESERGHRRS